MSLVNSIDHFGHTSGVFDVMNSAWGWPIAESIHFIGLSLLFGSIGLIDLRLMGFARGIALTDLHRITRIGLIGYVLNVVTGVAFFVSAPDQYLYNPAFQLKVLCMAVAGLNVVSFYVIAWPQLRAATSVPFIGRAFALVSLTAWTGVIVFGRLITFYRPPEHWCFWCG